MTVFIIQNTIIYTIPLLIVINLALEGEMIFGDCMGAVAGYGFQMSGARADTPQLMFIIAMIIAAASGAVFSLLLSFSAINLKADQTIGGTALNMLAPAIVCTMGLAFFNQEKLVMPKSTNDDIINDSISDFGRIFADKMYISTYIVIAVFVLLSIWVYKSKTGTRMRACGEHPQAAASVGVNVYAMRYLGTTISGALAGLGGYVYIATTAGGTAESTVAGMGFLALAIMIFGNWKPLGIALGAVMFGFLKCISVMSSQIEFLSKLDLPMYFYNIIPYFMVLVVLALTAKKSGCPKAEGIPYDKGMR